MLKLIRSGPVHIDSGDPKLAGVGHFKTPMRPLSAVEESIDDSKKPSSTDKEQHHD